MELGISKWNSDVAHFLTAIYIDVMLLPSKDKFILVVVVKLFSHFIAFVTKES